LRSFATALRPLSEPIFGKPGTVTQPEDEQLQQYIFKDPSNLYTWGQVTSDRMDKTIAVSKKREYNHRLYGKFSRFTKYYAHDEHQSCRVGDKVILRQLPRAKSKLKRWEVVHILKVGKRAMVIVHARIIHCPSSLLIFLVVDPPLQRDPAHEFAVKAGAIDRALKKHGVSVENTLPVDHAVPSSAQILEANTKLLKTMKQAVKEVTVKLEAQSKKRKETM